jgi:hypothetical protein
VVLAAPPQPPQLPLLPRLSDADLDRIARFLQSPLSPEGALNRYPQDVRALMFEVLALRREHASILNSLRQLPLEEVKPEDGPMAIVEKAQGFWLEYQRGLWGEKETKRLKAAADRANAAVEEGKRREERQAERIAQSEAAYAESQALSASLTEQVRELTDSLAATTGREAMHSQRVAVLESERAAMERSHAVEVSLAQSAKDATDREWSDRAEAAERLLHEAINALRVVRGAKEVPNVSTNDRVDAGRA